MSCGLSRSRIRFGSWMYSGRGASWRAWGRRCDIGSYTSQSAMITRLLIIGLCAVSIGGALAAGGDGSLIVRLGTLL